MMLNTQLGIENVASIITRAVRYGDLATVSSWFQTTAWVSGHSDREHNLRDGPIGN